MDGTRHRALVVGIDRYPKYRTLNGAEGDANDFESWLRDTVGVPEENIEKLVSSKYVFADVYNARPIAQQIHDWLNHLDALADGKGGDFPLGERVYVFFAGHGYNATTAQQTAMMPATRNDYWDVVPLLPLRTYLQAKAYFEEVVLVSDACRDLIDYAPDPAWLRPVQAHLNSKKVRVFEAYGAKAGQKAKELDFGGKTRGVLTQAFLGGVKGAAANADGKVWAHALESHIRFAVADKLGPDQAPAIDAPKPPAPMLICEAPQRLPKVVLEPTAETAGQAVLKSLFDNREETIDLAAGRQEFRLPAGFYSLTAPSGKNQQFIAAWEETHVRI
jgi:hypothetical protein